MTSTTATVAERVAAGAKLLDDKDPDWWREDADPPVDLAELDMSDGQKCVLGQRCPRELIDPENPGQPSGYLLYAGNLSGLDHYETEIWGARNGFDASPAAGHTELVAEWKRVISGRRSAA